MRELRLSSGQHPTPFDDAGVPTMCVMEFAAWLAGERHSDEPTCVAEPLKRFAISFNDNLPDDQRQRLRPLTVRMIGTAGDGQDERRSYMALDWLMRTYTPAFLDAAGLTDEAAKLRGLAAIEGLDDMHKAEPVASAAESAAWSAAESAAWSAAESAAWSAARSAAWSAARSAAESAAWSAAWSAARSALAPTVDSLRESAFVLLETMIDPGGIHDVKPELWHLERTGREMPVPAKASLK